MKKIILASILVLLSASLVQAQEYQTREQVSAAAPAEGVPTPMDYYDRFICYANSPNGVYFSAWGPNPYYAQQAAMNYCFRYSSLCRPDGCQQRY